MTYVPKTWVDESLTGAERFDIKENGGTAFKDNMQIALHTGLLVTPGTLVDADNMNNIEAGIQEALAAADTAQDAADVAHGLADAAQATANGMLAGANVLLASIVSTGVADEFDFTSISGSYRKLRLEGSLKYSFTGGTFPANTISLKLNGDGGPNYAFVNLYTGGWDLNQVVMGGGPVVGSWPADASLVNPVSFEFPDYASAVVHKWGLLKILSANTSGNPTGGVYEAMRLWKSASPITRIQVLGTYAVGLAHLELYGCPF
jgi:hypothetical protein